MVITYPFENCATDGNDKDYFPPSAVQLKTRQQAEEALKTSHQITEKFWTIWKNQYLTSLREKHKLLMNNKGGTRKIPARNTVVLIYDSTSPRNTWKLGRIHDLSPSENGIIREAHVKLPNGRVIRRPVNFLIPLELQDGTDTEVSPIVNNSRRWENSQVRRSHRYNLRPRRTNHEQSEIQPENSPNDTIEQEYSTNLQAAQFTTKRNNELEDFQRSTSATQPAAEYRDSSIINPPPTKLFTNKKK
ncbi:unnamed protein product [Haemonchus placei]|uniref:DUF5641 domain-containing protein n=1 Tax=Haemonchus placei TaxID=6290 RepID=A0A0N4X8Z8_HAEPC|nr:unnamed protein product [Haemonchus placei]